MAGTAEARPFTVWPDGNTRIEGARVQSPLFEEGAYEVQAT